jgi:membrane protein implicated in regulation of membrane protease activity
VTAAKWVHPLPKRPALAACGLWLAGAALAAATGLRALTSSEAGYAAVYAVVSVGLDILAVATYHAVRAAETVTLVLLASQIVGAAGAAVELIRGDDGGAKARHLQDLGLDFRLALLGNLVYSAAASVVFIWAWSEIRRRRRTTGRAVSRRS